MEQRSSVAFERCHEIAFLGFVAVLREFIAALHPNAISSAAALHPILISVSPQAKQSLATLTKDVPKRHSLAMPGETVLNGNQEWVLQADLPLTAAIRQSQQTLYHSHPAHSADRQGETSTSFVFAWVVAGILNRIGGFARRGLVCFAWVWVLHRGLGLHRGLLGFRTASAFLHTGCLGFYGFRFCTRSCWGVEQDLGFA